ncbi:MAG: queuosine precursor transporter [Thermomicrobiales bacterium]|nr:queuosine precursor transporter [Thermomicrobiales bacterium]
MTPEIHRSTGSIWFNAIIAIYVTTLITANTVAVSVLDLGPFSADAGTLTFPIAYIVGDVLTEVYGFRTARRVIWLGFACNLFAVGVYQLAMQFPTHNDAAFDAGFALVFSSTPRILLASMAAYLVGSFTNAFIMSRLKVMTNGKHLWMRTIGSTLAGQGLDTVVFVLIAFAGVFPREIVWEMIYTNWIIKIGIEVLATPVTYRVIALFKRKEGLDVYDVALKPAG